MRGVGVALLLSVWVVPAVGARALTTEPIGAESGVPAESVTAIYQDGAGFLWIGTREGLVFYDGSTFTLFDHDVADPTSISDNTIRAIFEDSRGNLWLGTNSGGLERLDRADWTFEHHRHDSADPTSISHDSVNVILEDRDGALWVGTQIGLNRLDPETGTFERIMSRPGVADSVSHDYIYALHLDDEGALWIGTVGGGLNRRDPVTGAFERYLHDPDDPATLGDDRVFSIVESPPGTLWLGTNSGVSRMDRQDRTITRVPASPGRPQPLVTSQAVGLDGVLWLGTWGEGLNQIDTTSAAPGIRRVEGDEERIVALNVDRDGALWVGTWSSGLLRLPSTLGLFTTVTSVDKGDKAGDRDATALYEDEAGVLWVGTWGSGLNRRDPGEERFRPFAPHVGSVLSVIEKPRGTLWAGTMTGLWRIDVGSKQSRQFLHDFDDPNSLGPGYITSLLEDRSGRLWIGTGGGGLNWLREDGRGFARFVHDPQDPNSISDDYVTSLFEGRDGTLWVGTRSGGLNALDPQRTRFDRHVPDPSDPRSLSHHYVTAVLEDDRGVLWVGTAGGGINRVDDDAGGISFRRFTERDGLIDDDAMALALGNDGGLWIGTHAGLARLDPETEMFASFGEGTGLPTTEFNAGSAVSGESVVYFGTPAGVVVVPSRATFPTPTSSPTVLRSVTTLQGRQLGDRPAWQLERLEMPYGEILSFQFAVLDYSGRHRHRYRYRMEGLRDEWVDLGTHREITLTNLDPGTYTLRAMGRNAQGVWSETPVALVVQIVPPFWMTAWFRMLVGVVVLGSVLAIHNRRTAVLERRNRELQALKDQREAALEEVRASQQALHEAYERLRRLTRGLEAAKEDERKRIARELHDEMGQALTTAKINLQLLADIADARERGRRIVDTVSLVDSMIGHVRALSLDLRPPLLDELGLVPALRGYLETQAQRSGIDIRVEAGDVPAAIGAEIEIAGFRAVQEAVTNVLRHAGARRVDVQVLNGDGRLDITVRDDGVGFNVEEALERAARGRHLGLLGIRERVESMGGSVKISSVPGKGTEIGVCLPLTTGEAVPRGAGMASRGG